MSNGCRHVGRNPPQPRTLLFHDGSVDLTQEAPKDSPHGKTLVKEDWKSVQGDKRFNRYYGMDG